MANASIQQYSDLLDTGIGIPSYLFGRTDILTKIPNWVSFVEASLNRKFRTLAMEARFTATLTAGNAFFAAPPPLIGFRRLKITSISPTRFLEYVTPDQLEFLWADDNFQDVPENYTIIGSEMQFGPVPDSNYTLEADIFSAIPPLATNSTNWLITSHPDVYLYGCLRQSVPFIGNDSRIGLWNDAYNQAVQEIEDNDQKQRYPHSLLRIRPDIITP